HESLARSAHKRHRLREEDAHRVAERDRLLVDATLRLHLLQRGSGQLDRRVEGERRELLPLRLLNVLSLLLGELAQTTHEILGIAAEGESESTTFHPARVAAPRSSTSAEPCGCAPRRRPAPRRNRPRPASRRQRATRRSRPAPARAAATRSRSRRGTRRWPRAAPAAACRRAPRLPPPHPRSQSDCRSRGARRVEPGARAGGHHPPTPPPPRKALRARQRRDRKSTR